MISNCRLGTVARRGSRLSRRLLPRPPPRHPRRARVVGRSRAGAMPTSSTFGASALRKGRSGAPSGSTAGTFGRPPPSPRRTAPMRTTPTPGESSARSGPASPYAGVAGAPSRAGAARTPGRISLVERQAQYALPSSASRTRPSGGPGASGTSPVARPAVAARRALAAGSAAPSRTAAAPTPSRGLERGLKTPGEKTPRRRRGSRRRRRRRPRRRPSDVRSGENQIPKRSRRRRAPRRRRPRAPPSHLGRPLRLRLDAAADADTAQTPGPAATAHEIPSAPRSRPAREAPPRAPARKAVSATVLSRRARRPAPPAPVPVPPVAVPGTPPGDGSPRGERIRPRPRPRVSLRPASGSLHGRALAPGAPLRVGGRSAGGGASVRARDGTRARDGRDSEGAERAPGGRPRGDRGRGHGAVARARGDGFRRGG